MILVNCCLQTGHSGFTLDHSNKQVRQNEWKHPWAKALDSILPKQIGQLGSGEERPDGPGVSVDDDVDFFRGDDPVSSSIPSTLAHFLFSSGILSGLLRSDMVYGDNQIPKDSIKFSSQSWCRNKQALMSSPNQMQNGRCFQWSAT